MDAFQLLGNKKMPYIRQFVEMMSNIPQIERDGSVYHIKFTYKKFVSSK